MKIGLVIFIIGFLGIIIGLFVISIEQGLLFILYSCLILIVIGNFVVFYAIYLMWTQRREYQSYN